MQKLRMALRLLLSKNYLVICDRHSAANVRHMFMPSFRTELRKMDKRFTEEIKQLKESE